MILKIVSICIENINKKCNYTTISTGISKFTLIFLLSLKIYFFLNRISRGSGRFSMHLNFFENFPIFENDQETRQLSPSLSLSLIYMLNWVHIERREWLIVVREFFAIKWTWREGKFCYSLVYQGEIL